jgi:predicted DNA-binding transcriptional regulator AlpA
VTPLLTIEDLANILRVSKESIITRRSRAPETLPPSLNLPGHKAPKWRQEDVEAWLASLAQPAPRRGRPRTQGA